MTIQEIRQKYPMYNDMSDKDLADRLHAKYYSDLPKADVYKKVGLFPSGVSEEEYAKITKPGHPADILQNIAVGLGKAGQNVAHFLGSPAEEVDIQAQLGPKNPNELVQGIAQYAPFAAASGPGLLGQALGGAAFGATQAPEGERMGEAGKGALINALTHGAFKGLEQLRPSNLLRGNLTPEQLQANVAAAEGTPTGLGSVVESPMLQRTLENILPKVPFSGANKKLLEAGAATREQGKDILGGMIGVADPENVTNELAETLMKQFKAHQSEKTALYDNVDKLASKIKFEVNPAEFSAKAKDYAEAIADIGLLKYEPEAKRIFKKLEDYRNGSGSPITLQEANILKGKLGEYAKSSKASPQPSDRHLAKVYGELASSLKSDINSSIDSSGNETLKEAYKKAEQNYAKNFSPFLDKEIYKFIGGQADPDSIVQAFLKSSRSRAVDPSNKISKLTNKLPEQQQNQLSYSYFSRALDKEGNLNPGKLNTLINDLGPKQFKVLVKNPEVRKALTDYQKLYSMNKQAVNAMENPLTGQRSLDVIPALLSGGLLGAFPGAIAGLLPPVLLARGATSALTSPAIRENLVRAMIANKPIQWPVAQSQSVLQSLFNQ